MLNWCKAMKKQNSIKGMQSPEALGKPNHSQPRLKEHYSTVIVFLFYCHIDSDNRYAADGNALLASTLFMIYSQVIEVNGGKTKCNIKKKLILIKFFVLFCFLRQKNV